MPSWTDRIDALLGELDAQVRGTSRRVRDIFRDAPHEILCYRGYGTSDTAHVWGRVVEQRDIGESSAADSTLRNLLNTVRRVDSDPLALADVEVQWSGARAPFKTDDEGFFTTSIAAAGIRSSAEWQTYDVELIAPLTAGAPKITGTGEIFVPPLTATFGVISDLDDTVIQSRVSNFLQAARTVMLGNARTRLPFPGVAAFYSALRNGAAGVEANPIFYVSSSPWNIYDVISEFLDLQGIPKGPLLLRDWDINFGALASERHLEHKGGIIRDILNRYPTLPFILMGDSGQHDPEIYRQIVGEFPDRIRAVYIRDVTRSAERTTSIQALATEILAAHSVLVLAEDTLDAAQHAAEQGWISAAALDGVRDEKRADTGQDAGKVASPEGGERGQGTEPTIIGESEV